MTEVVQSRPQTRRSIVAEAAREALNQARSRVAAGDSPPGLDALVRAVQLVLDRVSTPSLRPVVNATGVILHTNLGRAPLSAAAVAAMSGIASSYSNLELDLESGERGSRASHLRTLLQEVTGAEDGLAV